MSGQEITLVCPDCQSPVTAAPDMAGEVVRCEACFEVYLREADDGFLDNYAEFGSVSHRVIAENAVRGLVTASPGERKVLMMAVFEQFLQVAHDLLGLYSAIKDAETRPLIESFLGFKLDAARTRDFFADMEELSDSELLEALGLPEPEQIVDRFPDWDRKELGYAANALWKAMNGLRRSAASPFMNERGLLQALNEVRRTMPLTSHASWIPDAELGTNQVGAMLVDYRHRRIALSTLTVDEGQLSEMVDAIDLLSQTAGDLAYAYVLLRDRNGNGRPRLGPPV